jgi:hypothetical protein
MRRAFHQPESENPMEFIFTCRPATILRRPQISRLGESRDNDSESFGLIPVAGDLPKWQSGFQTITPFSGMYLESEWKKAFRACSARA